MERSKFIAGIAGPIALALGLSVFLNRDMFPGLITSMQSDPAIIMVAGVVALTAGLAIVKTQNVWNGWPAVITLLGWLLILGGLGRILLPQQLAEFAAGVIPGTSILLVPAVLLTLLGAFMTYKGNT